MINSIAKLLFGLAAASLALGIGAAFAIDDPAGVLALIAIFALFSLAGLATAGSGIKDHAPRFDSPADGPPLAMTTVDQGLVPRPSRWPFVGALAVGALGLGLAAGTPLVIIGLVVGLLTAAGWLGQAWRDDPTYTPREGSRISERFLAPLGLPLLAVSLIAVIVISSSRVLLAVSKTASVVIAFVMAVGVLLAFYAISARPRLGKGAMVALGGLTVAALVTAGGVSAASGYRTFEHHAAGTEAAGPTSVEAKGLKFLQTEIAVTQSQIATIRFTNEDPTYHNIAVYSDQKGGTPYWNGEPVKGVANITYTHEFSMAPGTYAFRCDFHPAMVGTFVVKAAP